MHHLSLAFQWNIVKTICAKFKRAWHSTGKLTTNEFNNNYKQTSNLTKFRSFALHKRNEKIYRKPHNTVKYGFRTARSISQTESKLWHQPRKSYSTGVFPLLSAFDLSDSALSINANDHGQAGYLNQLGYLNRLGSLTYLGPPPTCRQALIWININNLIFFSAAADEMETKRNQEG